MRHASALLLSALCLCGCGRDDEASPSVVAPPPVDQPRLCELLVGPDVLSERLGVPLRPVEDAATGENAILPEPEPGQLRCEYAVDLQDEPDRYVRVTYNCRDEAVAPLLPTATPGDPAYTARNLPIAGATARLEASPDDPLGVHRVVGRDIEAQCDFTVVTTRVPAEGTAIVAVQVVERLTPANRPDRMHWPRTPVPEATPDPRT